jgi:hypothetical protein
MDRRKEELEKKRQKLAELRRAREERRALLESQSTQSTSVMIEMIFSFFVELIFLIDHNQFCRKR